MLQTQIGVGQIFREKAFYEGVRPASVETVQGGVPPYGVKETLVVNGKW